MRKKPAMAPTASAETTGAEDRPTEREAQAAVKVLLNYIGEDLNRDGLLDTPARVVRAMDEIFRGYVLDPVATLGTHFEPDGYDQMVLLSNCEFYSTCEHHMQPFFGVAHVAYLPVKRVVGISKLARLVDIFARRLQIQERMTQQIAETLMAVTKPRGVAVLIEARHFCMVCRGVQKQNSIMSTSALLGVFREQVVRNEFLSLVAQAKAKQ